MPNYLTPRTSGPAKVNPDPPMPKTVFKKQGDYNPNHDRPRKRQLGEGPVTIFNAPKPPKFRK